MKQLQLNETTIIDEETTTKDKIEVKKMKHRVPRHKDEEIVDETTTIDEETTTMNKIEDKKIKNFFIKMF